MKKLSTIALLAFLCLFVGTASAASYTDDESGLIYTLNSDDSTAKLTAGSSSSKAGQTATGDVVIPSEITVDGTTYTVTEIGDYAWAIKALTSITIPATVTTIGKYAFYNCSQLTSVTFADDSQLTTIDNYAFYGCSITSVSIPATVTTTGQSIFNSCKKLETVTFDSESQLPSISRNMFSSCTSLTGITIPESVTLIDYMGFSSCTALTEITIPENVESFGTQAFYSCTALEKITIPESVTSIGYEAFDGCTALTEITIPSSVTSIGDMAFYGCTGITKITIPETVTTFGSSLFRACSNLSDVTLPDNLEAIAEGMFYGCSALEEITIPEGVTSIGSQAFYSCTSLKEIIIPKNVTSIGQYAFYQCSSLEKVSFADDSALTTIDSYAFRTCEALTEITIPKSVTSIGQYAFYQSAIETVSFADDSALTTIDTYAFAKCSSLKEITIPKNVTSIGDYVFYQSALEKVSFADDSALTTISARAFRECTSLTEITIPKNVTSIGQYAFYMSAIETVSFADDSALTTIDSYAFRTCEALKEITIPKSVTSIGDYAFRGCVSLTTVNISDDSALTSIGKYAFAECTSLTETAIPAGVTSIQTYTFSGCSSLTSLTCYATDPPSLGSSALSSTSSNLIVYVPAGCVDAYKEKWNWSETSTYTFAEIEEEERDPYVELYSITDPDGNDMTCDIVDGELKLETLVKGTVIKVYSNVAEGNHLYLRIGDNTSENNTYLEDCLYEGVIAPDSEGIFTYTVKYTWGLRTGSVYPVYVALGTGEHYLNGFKTIIKETNVLTIVGGGESPYSEAEIKSIDPEPYEINSKSTVEINEGTDLVITMTFTEAVTVDEDLTNLVMLGIEGDHEADFQSIVATGSDAEEIDGATYSTEWTFTVAYDDAYWYVQYNSGEMPFHVYVKDADGKYIEGNDYQEDANVSGFYYTFELELGELPEVELTFDPADGATVKSLSGITVSVDEGNTITFNTDGSIDLDKYVIQKDEEDTNYVLYYDGTGGSAVSNSFTLTIVDTTEDEDGNPSDSSVEITEAGTYTITIPAGMFLVDGTAAYPTEDITLTYYVTGETETNTVEITVELAGSTLDEGITVSVEGGSVTFTTDENASYEDIVLKDAEGNIVSTCTGTKPDEANGTVTIYFEDLDEDLSDLEEGEYTLTLEIPEGLFVVTIDDETYTNEETTAEYTYTVNAETSNYELVYTPADGAKVPEISTLQILEANGQELLLNASEADIVVYDADGNKVTTGVDYGSEAIKGANDIEIGYDIPFEDEITTAGTYTIVIPKDFVLYGDWDGPGNDEVTLTVTISGEESVEGEGGSGEGGTETGISAINAAIADGGEVYNLAGQKVNAPVKGNVYIIKSAGSVKKMLVK